MAIWDNSVVLKPTHYYARRDFDLGCEIPHGFVADVPSTN